MLICHPLPTQCLFVRDFVHISHVQPHTHTSRLASIELQHSGDWLLQLSIRLLHQWRRSSNHYRRSRRHYHWQRCRYQLVLYHYQSLHRLSQWCAIGFCSFVRLHLLRTRICFPALHAFCHSGNYLTLSCIIVLVRLFFHIEHRQNFL